MRTLCVHGTHRHIYFLSETGEIGHGEIRGLDAELEQLCIGIEDYTLEEFACTIERRNV